MAELNRSLNLVQLVFYGVGTMVGAGIYSVIGAAAGEAGVFLWVSFLLAGAAAFLTVLSYAELSSALSEAGAEYQFMKAAFPKWKILAFLAGYLIALNAAATSATVALAFAGYLSVFTEVPKILSAFVLLAACTAINIAGIKQSTWASIALICVEVAGLLLMIWAGFTQGEPGKSFESMPDIDASGGIFAATALVFFIFIGFEDVANLSEEAHEPKKNVPRALIVSVLVTSVIYVLVSLAVIAVSDPQQLAGSESPLTLAAGSVAPWMGQTLAVVALFATASTALISLISISRLLFGMGRGGDMPAALAKTLPGRKTPWVAALVLFGAACLLLPLGEVKTVASISSLGVILVFIGVHMAVIALRFNKPQMKRGFTVPLAAGKLPLLPVLGIAASLALLTQFEPIVYMIGGAAVALGLGMYGARAKLLAGRQETL